MTNHGELASAAQLRLAEFFTTEMRSPGSAGASRKYTDTDFLQISTLLQESGNESWSFVPRIYTVLRTIGQLQHLNTFIDQGITDIWFPFDRRNVPDFLTPTNKSKFLQIQSVVFTKTLDLEKGPQGRHQNLSAGDVLPFETKGRLGSGAYGVVDKVLSTRTFKEYARKRIRRTAPNFRASRAEIERFKEELAALKRLRHEHCVELVGSYTDPVWFGLIMLPIADSDLKIFLAEAIGSADKRSLIRGFFGCLARAVQYLHGRKIRHRDIKPANILVKGDNVLLTDFGIALDWSELSRSTTTADSGRSPVYSAPEVMMENRPRNSSTDIWSLGCVFLEMASVLKGKPVEDMRHFFEEKTEGYRFYNNIEQAIEWMKCLRTISKTDDEPLNWISEMLQLEHLKRPTADQVVALILHSGNDPEPISDIYCGICCRDDGRDDGTDENLLVEDPWASDSGDESSALEPLSGDVSQIEPQAPTGTRVPLDLPNKPSRTNNSAEKKDEFSSAQKDPAVNKQAPHSPTQHAIASEASKTRIVRTPIRVEVSQEAIRIRQLRLSWLEKRFSTEADDPSNLAHPSIAKGIPEETITVAQAAMPFTGVETSQNKSSEAASSPVHGTSPLEDDLLAMAYNESIGYALKRSLHEIQQLPDSDESKYTSINNMTREEQREAIRVLCSNGHDVSAGCDLQKALSWAAIEGHKLAVQLLIALPGIRPDFIDESGNTPLLDAVNRGHTKVVEVLLPHKAVEPDRPDTFGSTPLLLAAKNGYVDIMRLLMAQPGVSMNAESDNGTIPLQQAVAHGHIEAVKLLLTRDDLLPNLVTKHILSPLHCAIELGHWDIVELLVARLDIEVNVPVDEDGNTPLIRAIDAGKLGVVQLLVGRADVKIDSENNLGITALHLAAGRGFSAAVSVLLGKLNYSGINKKTLAGMTALMLAAFDGSSSTVLQLLAHPEISINEQDPEGYSALMFATEQGYEGIVRMLLANSNTNVNLMCRKTWRNRNEAKYYTALDFARHKGRETIYRMLKAEGGRRARNLS